MKLLAGSALMFCLAIVGCADTSGGTDPANFADTTKVASTQVEGMTCSGCEGSVCAALKEIDGVKDVKADAKTGEVMIALEDGAKLDTQAVQAAIADLNFTSADIKLPEGFCPKGCTKDCCKPADEDATPDDTTPKEPVTDDQASTETQTEGPFYVANYKVTGMDCGGCEWTINTALAKLDGVKACKADAKTGNVELHIAEGQEIKGEQIAKTLKAADSKFDLVQ